jgi:hypothetical protein
MPRTTANDDAPIAPDHGRIAAVQALIGLAHRHIGEGLSRAANIDTQALGLIGLDAGLIAIVLAAHETLGPHYWVAIPGLAVSILLAGSVLAVTRFDIGPDPEQLYAKIEAAELSGEATSAKLLADLVETKTGNRRPLQSKVIRLVIATGVFALTIIYTALEIVL